MTNANVVVGLLQIIQNTRVAELHSEAMNILRIIANSTTTDSDFTFYEDISGAVQAYVKLLLSSNDAVYAQAAQALGLYGGDDAPCRELRRLLDGLAKLLGLPADDPKNIRIEVGEDGEVYEGVVSPYFFGVRPALAKLFCGSGCGANPLHLKYAAKLALLCERVYPEQAPALSLPPPRTPSPPPKVLLLFSVHVFACFSVHMRYIVFHLSFI